MPSNYHEVTRHIATVFYDFASVYFGRVFCQSPVVILEFQASYLPGECENPQLNLTLEFSQSGSLQWLKVCLWHKAFESIDPGMLSGKNSLNPLNLNLNLTIEDFGDFFSPTCWIHWILHLNLSALNSNRLNGVYTHEFRLVYSWTTTHLLSLVSCPSNHFLYRSTVVILDNTTFLFLDSWAMSTPEWCFYTWIPFGVQLHKY